MHLAGWLLVAALAAGGDDIASARAVFQANLDAIRNRDRDVYLSCYLNAQTLARTGPEGFTLGYEPFAAQAGDGWPDLFEASSMQLVPVRPGVVYGTYRYRVRYGADEQTGISERLFIKTDTRQPHGGWRIAMTSALPALAGTPPPPRALAGGTLLDGTGGPPVADAVVVVRAGKIDCAGPRAACPVPAGVEVVDTSGKWITPGLIDAHVHFSQTGWADGRPDALDLRDAHPYEGTQAELRAHPERFFRAYLCSGVTAVFDVGGYPWTLSLRETAEADTRAPHLAAAGPLLSTRDHWLNLPAERQFIFLKDAASAREGVAYLKSRGADAVKVWFIVSEPGSFEELSAAVMEAGSAASAAGLPLIVHATGLREAKVALKAGAKLLVHSVGDVEVDQEFIDLALKTGAIYCPTLTVRDGYGRMAHSVAQNVPPEVDDPHGCVDPGTLDKIRSTPVAGKGEVTPEESDRRAARIASGRVTMSNNLKRVVEAGIPIAMGTDAGNPLTLHGPSVYAEMEAMQAAGLTPMQVLVASTQGGARAMGRLQTLGTLAPGKAGDLLVLSADPSADIRNMRQAVQVMRGGVLRRIEEFAPAF